MPVTISRSCARRARRSLPSIKEVRHLPYTPDQMFDLVADVARYGEFLPWVAAVRVRSNSEAEMVADLVVGFKGLSETFTSRVHKKRPVRIAVDYIQGPLKHLHNEWLFEPDGHGGTNVHFTVDFAFRSAIFEALAGQMFERAFRKMTQAFEDRAAALYGSVASGISNSSAHNAA